MIQDQSTPLTENNLNTLKETILIVEDHFDSLLLLEQILSEQGYKVQSALNGQIALQIAHSSLPDLILLDILMPEINGYQVCEQLKVSSATKDIPVIFISALHNVFDKVKAFSLGGVDYITKPLQAEEVVARVENQLNMRRLTKQQLEQNARLIEEIEARKKIEHELQDTQQLLRAMADANPHILYIYDLIEKRNVYTNHKIFSTIGYTPEEVQQMGDAVLSNLMHPDDLAVLPEYFQQFEIAKEGEILVNEYRMRAKNGEWRWLASRDTLFTRTADGKPQQILGTATDISTHKQAEDALRKSEQRLQLALEASEMGLWDWTLSTGEIYYSPQWKTMLGYSVEEIKDTFESWEQLLHPDDLPKALAAINAHLQGQSKHYEVEFRMRTKSGEWMWILSRGKVIERDILGNSLRVTGTHKNINQRKQTELDLRIAKTTLEHQNQQLQREIRIRQHTEAALKKSEERWHLALKGNNEGIWDLNLKTNYVFRSTRYKELMGYEEHELGDDNDDWASRIHPDDFERVMQANHDYLERKIPYYAVEYRLRCKDDSYKWVLGRAQAVWDKTGKPVRMVGSTTDINTRKQAEAALIESEKKYRLLVETSQDIIWSLDIQGNYTFVNTAVKKIYGYDPGEMIGRSFTDFVVPKQRIKSVAIFQRLLKGTSVFQYETIHLGKDNRVIHLMLNAIAQRDSQGNVVGLSGTASDITQRKCAERALRQSEARYRIKVQELELTLEQLKYTQSQLIQSEKMSSLGQMLAGIAHEINNPVSFVYSNIAPATEYVQDLLNLIKLYQYHYPEPVVDIFEHSEAIEVDFIAEDFPRLLTSMKEGANRITQIVLSLRNFSRLDEQESKQVDIHQGLDNTLVILQHRLKAVSHSDGIEVIKYYSQLPKITCYASHLNQVFMNLLNNAIDALENQPYPRLITISTALNQTSNPQHIIIRITDNGLGMSEEVKQKIFDPFFTTKPVGKGTGLGLSISYQIVVEKHKGQLSCISVLGEGTEFIIELPLS